jgi:hypothetical protein
LAIQKVEWDDDLLLSPHDSYHPFGGWLLVADFLLLQEVEELSVLQG